MKDEDELYKLLYDASEKGDVANLRSTIDKIPTDQRARLLSKANTSDNFEKTPLHIAVGNGHTECLRMLVIGGADIDKEDKYGQTPMHWAAGNGHTECVKKFGAGC